VKDIYADEVTMTGTSEADVNMNRSCDIAVRCFRRLRKMWYIFEDEARMEKI